MEVTLDDSNGFRSGERDSTLWSIRDENSIYFRDVIFNTTTLPVGDLLLEETQGINTFRLRRNLPDPGTNILTSDLEGYSEPDLASDTDSGLKFPAGASVLLAAFTVDLDGNLWGYCYTPGTFTPEVWLLCQEANGYWNIRGR